MLYNRFYITTFLKESSLISLTDIIRKFETNYYTIILLMSDKDGGTSSWPVRVWRFYRDGFRQMTVGRSLWVLIIIKLIFIFAIMKLFFFPNLLSRDYDTDDERSEAVRRSMLAPERVSSSVLEKNHDEESANPLVPSDSIP